jgi:hydrogenase maturation factor
MHDPTEGGVAMGVQELSDASGRPVELLADKVMIGPETALICAHYNIDALGLLGSGALLATFAPKDAGAFVAELNKMKISAGIVGTVKKGKGPSTMIRDGVSTPLSSSERDEVLKVL